MRPRLDYFYFDLSRLTGPERHMYWLGVLLATIGAGLILSALAFVSTVIGGLVNAMIVLMCGPLIDRVASRRGRASAR